MQVYSTYIFIFRLEWKWEVPAEPPHLKAGRLYRNTQRSVLGNSELWFKFWLWLITWTAFTFSWRKSWRKDASERTFSISSFIFQFDFTINAVVEYASYWERTKYYIKISQCSFVAKKKKKKRSFALFWRIRNKQQGRNCGVFLSLDFPQEKNQSESH